MLSCGFIAGFNYILLIYIVIFSIINYYLGIRIPIAKYKQVLFRIGILINLLQLILLKYSSFAVDPVLRVFHINIEISKLTLIILPIGISYFTLQGIGYLINIKMGWEKPEKKFEDFLLYIVFYPKFLSGPIERSNHFLPQLKINKSFNEHQVTEGLRIALFGFFKKVVIANQLGVIITSAYSDLSGIYGLNFWIIIIVQPLYLYFDFSGYTEIAIGIAKAYGIDLLPNFNKPFLSENVTNFWKRFHMSLSLWFNDYVFKQLSFKYRKWGKYASVFAVFVTFTLFGIWHGAGWNFMVLGLAQALAINYEFFTKKKRTEIFSKIPVFLRVWSGRLFTYLFFGLSLVFFFSPDLNTALRHFAELFNSSLNCSLNNFNLWSSFALVFAVLFLSIDYINQDLNEIYKMIIKFWTNHRLLRMTVYYFMVFLIMSQMGKKLIFIYQTF